MRTEELIKAFPKGTPPYQIDIEKAIDYFIGLDHLYLYEFPESIDGFLLYLKGEPIIAINSKHSKRRIHWTMTHEFVEFLLSKEKSHKPISFSLRNTDFEQEKVVNRITAELLLPEFVLRSAVNIFLASGVDGVNDEFVHEISEHFNVSKHAVIWRLKELGYNEFEIKGERR
jgi:Zn-dependent peptidase ImmA (M78 family)